MTFSLYFILSAYGATLRTVATRRSGSNGFTIHPVAPASRARFFFSVSLSVVSTRIGVFYAPDCGAVADDFVAVHSRHVDVGDDDIDLLLDEDVEAVLAIDRLEDIEAGFRERQHQHVAHRLGVIDGQNSRTHGTLTDLLRIMVADSPACRSHRWRAVRCSFSRIGFADFRPGFIVVLRLTAIEILHPINAEILKCIDERRGRVLDRYLAHGCGRGKHDLNAGKRQRLDRRASMRSGVRCPCAGAPTREIPRHAARSRIVGSFNRPSAALPFMDMPCMLRFRKSASF